MEILTASAARAPEAAVYGVDVNQRALELARRNARSAGLDNVRFFTAEEVDPSVSFSAIWSNPPIRIGKKALHELLETWLPRLEPGGLAHLVVQKHLGSDSLQRWLTDSGWPASRLASRSSYRILEVQARVR